MRWSSRLLVAAGFGYALYAIRTPLAACATRPCTGTSGSSTTVFFEIPFPGNVLAPENGHSMVLPSLIWLANMLVFRGDETPLFAIALALLVAIAALLIHAVLRDRGRECAESSLLIVSALAATFWLAKLQILISAGFTIIYAFPILGLLLGVRSLTSIDVAGSRRPRTLVGGLGGRRDGDLQLRSRPGSLARLGIDRVGAARALAQARGVVPGHADLHAPDPGRSCLAGSRRATQTFPIIILAPLENLKHWLQLLGSPVANTWAGIAHARDVDPMLALGVRDRRRGSGCLGIAASLAERG